MIRRYSDIKGYLTLKERFEYLALHGSVADMTFGGHRYVNQRFYTSKKWKAARDEVIIRDDGCDLGIPGYTIMDKLLVHHMNPITIEDLEEDNPDLYNPEFLICVSENTHNAIHFGSFDLLPQPLVERFPNDMCPWKLPKGVSSNG